MALSFSQGLLSSLTNPNFNLTGVGQQIGGLGGQRRQAEQEALKQQQATGGLLSAYQLGAAPGGADPAAALAAMAQGTNASPEQAQAMLANMQAGQSAAEAGGQREAAQQQAKAWAGYLTSIGRTDLIGVDPAAARDIIKAELQAKKEQRGITGSTFASVGNFKDGNGNIYSVTEQRNKQGGIDTLYNAITPGAPKEPKGELTPIGGSYNIAAGEVAAFAGDKKEAEEFGKSRSAAAIQLPELQSSLSNIDTTLDLLSTVDTGGPINIANTAIEAFLGTTSADKAELQVLLGNEMYKRLKPLFGGVISEGERQVIEKIYGGLKKGNPANEGILRSLRRDIEAAITKSNMIRRANSPEEYNDILDKMYPKSSSESGDRVVNWSDR